jgi:hypothetical protein
MAYDKEKVFNSILSEIEEGASLRSVLRREDMPSRYTFFEWLHNNEVKTNQYARACELRAEAIFEDILEIADETSGDKKYTDAGEVIDSEYVARSRVKIDARKWMLGKMQPKKYGDKIQQEHSGEITTNIISLGNGINPDEVTD